jgi:hypothetical protein
VQASTNAPTFFVLAADLRTLRLSAGVDEADIGRVEVGQKVMSKVDAYGGQEFEGTVDTVRLNATNTNNVVTYPVWIRVPNPELKLRPSMTATLRVIIQTAPNVVRVPNQALRFRPNTDIYTALGIEPPAAGRGRSLASEVGDTNGGNGRAQGAGPGQSGTTPPGGQQATPQGGQQGRERTPGAGAPGGGNRQPGAGQNRQQGGTGFGRQTGMGNLTPEQIQQFREKFGRGGGGSRGAGGGRGGGGRGNNQGGRGANAGTGQNTTAPPVELTADKIDELFAPVQRPEQRASVYTYDGTKTPPELKQVNIRLGVTDGTFSELLSDNLQVEQQLVTGVILPMAQRPNQPGQSIFGQPQRGMGGMTPGDRGGPGGGGNPGGGNPGGGGGGGGGGRGGGGRGGGN